MGDLEISSSSSSDSECCNCGGNGSLLSGCFPPVLTDTDRDRLAADGGGKSGDIDMVAAAAAAAAEEDMADAAEANCLS